MKPKVSYIFLLALMLAAMPAAAAPERADTAFISHTDSVRINFRQSKWNLDPAIGDNEAALSGIERRLTQVLDDSVYRLRHVAIIGGASPEGSVAFNRFLSEERAATLFGWFDRFNQLSDLEKTYTFLGRDWEGVLRLARTDSRIPYRDETIALLEEIASEKRATGQEPPRSLQRLKQLRGGEPYFYLYRHIFPDVRASKVIIDYDRVLAPDIVREEPAEIVAVTDTIYIDRTVVNTDTIYFNSCPPGPFYMDIRTNMVYDLLAVPNIGVEFYLGKNWTIGANYMHAWWSYDPRHRYWRLYGGELNVRHWFGKAANEKPLTGHHIGAYIQAVTWDFEWGGRGYMGGKPHGNIFDLAHFGIGAEYGYSLPVAKRFNIDFSLGVGYIGGTVHEFIPYNGYYLWQTTKKKRWFGPTKIEVSLVWLIGRGNYNRKKGGAQ